MTRSTKFRLLAAVAVTVALLTSLLGPVATPASAVADVTTKRLGGADRFATAAAVARESHAGAATALIANGLNFPDALAGSTLAGAVNAPILLVTPDSIPAVTSSALSDLGVDDVVILGGPAAVGPTVEAQLRQNYGVTRVQGDDRFKTAVEIARRAAVGGVGTVDGLRTAFVSTGLNFPDALGAGPLAYEGNLPSLLTRTNDLPAETAQVIRDLNIEHVVILGGTQAVSDTVKTQIEATGASTERLNGKNRAETATFVADFALARMDFEGVNTILARGDNFPDALAGGPLGGERRAVILLTATPCQLAIETRVWLEEHFGTVARIFILGGPSAVCDAVAREAEEAAETNNLPPSQVDLTIAGGSTNGGPKWQYQEEDASPSKSLSLSAFVSSDPPEGSDEDADRIPAAREDVVFNIKPTQGDAAGNTELNLSARTDSNGVARVTYTRGNPGTDTITVRVVDDTTLTDSGVGRWDGSSAPILVEPDTAATVKAGETREFTVTLDEGTNPEGHVVNLTTLELVDDDPTNDTNKSAISITGGGASPLSGVEDDRQDTDETLYILTTDPDGTATIEVTSTASQIFTLMGFLDSVEEPASNDDNTDPPEFRDIGGPTAFSSTLPGLNITPATDNNDTQCGTETSCIVRRNGQQIVYSVTAVDPQGQPLTAPVDVSFRQLADGNPVTTTTAEFDWFDNSDTPSTEEGLEDQVPPGAAALASGTTRFEVIPNSNGVFTFAVTHPRENQNTTGGNPMVWVDLPGGVNNRPDSSEPQAVGENFSFNAGSLFTATLESLGCPPGTDQRGTGNNPLTIPDPCLGREVMLEDPSTEPTEVHVPWSLDAAAISSSANAATTGAEADPSRGDVIFRFTYRDAVGEPVDPTIVNEPVIFEIDVSGTPLVVTGRVISAAPNSPNDTSDQGRPIASSPSPTDGVIEVPISADGIAEIVIDAASAGLVTVRARLETSDTSCLDPSADPSAAGYCVKTVNYLAPAVDTTANETIGLTNRAPSAQCPSPEQPCLNGNLVVIDKARDYYVMNTGGTSGAQAYVVYARGGGGEPAGAERPSGVDEYFIGGLPADQTADSLDNERCGHFSSVEVPGCAEFDAALSFDDRMVYEFAGAPPNRTQTHWLTNGG